jgi:hypothetical protein
MQVDFNNIWHAHFGQPGGGGAGADANAVVPEPTTFVMLIMAASSGCPSRRRAHEKHQQLINA